MGNIIEINDTLQITSEQGFPEELSYEKHAVSPFSADQFKDKEFAFRKAGIRLYKFPPVRNFLVENKNGKWLYWGLIHVVEVSHNYSQNTTTGKFKIVYIYTLEEMKIAHGLIDRNLKNSFFD